MKALGKPTGSVPDRRSPQILSEQPEFETDMGFPDFKICTYAQMNDRIKKVKGSKKKRIILQHTFFFSDPYSTAEAAY